LGFDKYIILKRKNYLKKIVSSLTARQTKRWHLREGEQAPLTPVRIDIDNVWVDAANHRLVECLEGYEEGFRCLDALLEGREALRLTYEGDIEADPRNAYQQVCEYLKIEAASVAPRLGRTTPYPLKQVLANYAEVEAALSGTRFGWMMSD
jgi:LPS sulfotransferase NodH